MAKTGRPRQFDREKAVDEALHLFWERGFDGASVSELRAAIGEGISAPSLYAAFGSKEGLYREATTRYLQTHGQVMAPLTGNDLPPREAIEMALRATARMQTDPCHPAGCMIAMGAIGIGPRDGDTFNEPLREARIANREGIRRCIARGRDIGELRADIDIDATADAFNSFLLGLSGLARDHASHDRLDAAVSQAMLLWDANTKALG